MLEIRKEVNRLFGYGFQIYNGFGASHTAGCCLDDVPDIIVMDCVELKGRHLIRALHERWMEDGYFTGEATLGQSFNGTPMRVLVVELDEEVGVDYCWQGERLYEFSDDLYRGHLPCYYVQLVWSDAYGRLPGEAGYSQTNNPQKLLSEFYAAT